MKPAPYNPETYVQWHEATVVGDGPLLRGLTELRDQMVASARPDLEFLRQLIAYMFTYTRNEYRHSRGQEPTYHTPLSDAIVTGPGGPSPRYDALFKSVPSVEAVGSVRPRRRAYRTERSGIEVPGEDHGALRPLGRLVQAVEGALFPSGQNGEEELT
jgi:hypothetical protein